MENTRSTAAISVLLATLGFAAFAMAGLSFDPNAYANDLTVVGLFMGAGLFGLSGMYRPQAHIAASDFMALAVLFVGLLMFLMVAFGTIDSVFMGCSLGAFMIVSAGIYVKAGMFSA